MSFLDDIVNRLVAQNVGAINKTIFRSSQAHIPDGAGPYITVTQTPGSAPTRRHNATTPSTQRPMAQIVARAANYEDAYSKIHEAYNALDGIYNTVLSGTFYQSIVAVQEPGDIGKDDAGRPMIGFNISAEKSPS